MNEIGFTRLSYPRVSDIIGIQNASEMRGISLEVLANAAIRGTKVHEYCTAYVNGAWIPEVEPEYSHYVNAFIEWADKNVEECLYSAERLYDDTRIFTGEFDLIVKLKDSKRIAMIDIKTSSTVSKSWPVQLAAYKHLCEINDFHLDCFFNLQIKQLQAGNTDSPGRAKTKLIEYENLSPYWEIFSSALVCYDYFTRKEKKNVCV